MSPGRTVMSGVAGERYLRSPRQDLPEFLISGA
jgi:hypothetical protein